jgi:hypothetical protein
MTLYSPDYGFVGYIGCSQKCGITTTLPNDFPKWFWERIPYAIYHDLSTVAGESILESRLGCNSTGFTTHLIFNPIYALEI